MRIISQNGIADIPYDLYGVRQLSSNLSKIIAFNNSDEYLVMAEYSSVEKAKKAMEMLHEAYACERYFQFPSDEDVSGSGTKRSKSFGEKVLNILKHKGISQRELAEKVGCTEVSMSRYISGERVPKAPIVVKIADVLGVTVEYLVSDSIE